MVHSELLHDYEDKVGPVGFTLSRVSPDRLDDVEQMMRDAIDGKRGPITDEELDIDIPSDAES